RFISDQILTQRFRSSGGAVLYEVSEPIFNTRQPLSRINLRVDKGDLLIPDVAVVPSGLVDDTEAAFSPQDVLLAVEVVSPHTRRRDRAMKPSAYADARIPFYWRVEPSEGPTIYIHELDGDGYRLVQKCGAGRVATVTGPFGASLDPAALLRPRG
ncbi:Uma2 family endonuclease, partial [Streptosporangium sp. NPDC003464]